MLIKGREAGAAINALHLALKKVEKWCHLTRLSINLDKIELVILTHKCELNNYKVPRLSGVVLQAKDLDKYINVVLDKKLICNAHLKAQCNKFLGAFWTCQRAYSST